MSPALAGLTEDHAAVYDRQLRVWGVEVQRRLMEAKVLIIGLGGLAAEVAKNIVLAGVGTVALRDDAPVASAASGNFLVDAAAREAGTGSVADACARTLQAMNPLMLVKAVPGPAVGCTAEDLAPYDTVVACGLPLAESVRLDELCRTASPAKQLFACAVVGPSSYAFVDLGQHSYSVKGEQGERMLPYPSFREALTCELGSPACSINKRTHPLYLVLRACWAFEQQHGRPPSCPADEAALCSLAADLCAAAKQQPSVLPEDLLLDFARDQQHLLAASPAQEAAGTCDTTHGSALGELPPVCAVVGGVVANNVLRAVSHVNAPLRNVFLYSLGCRDGLGVEECFPAGTA